MEPGLRDPMASVHTDLQNYLSQHHGKTTQVSTRINTVVNHLASIRLKRRDIGCLTFGEPVYVHCGNPECAKESSSGRQSARR